MRNVTSNKEQKKQMTDKIEQAPRSGLEKHIQTGIQVLLIAVCGWMATTVQETSIQVAKLSERVAYLQVEVSNLETAASDRYTKTDALEDLSAINDQLRDIRERLRAVEVAD